MLLGSSVRKSLILILTSHEASFSVIPIAPLTDDFFALADSCRRRSIPKVGLLEGLRVGVREG